MIIIPITNPPLEDLEKTALARSSIAGATTLNVFSGLGFGVDQFLILGNYGEENAEIVRIHNTTVPTNNQITLFAPTRFAHATNTPVRRILHNQWRVHRSDNNGLTFLLEATIDVRPDFHQTVYISAAAPSARFRISSFNSVSAREGIQSDAIAATGLDFASLGAILDRVYDLYNDPTQKFIKSDSVLISYLNEGYLDMWTRMSGLGQGYGVKRTGTESDPDVPMVAGRALYNQLVDLLRPVKIAMDYSNSGKFATARPYDPLLKSTDDELSETEPGYAFYHDTFEIDPRGRSGGRIRFWYVFMPTPLTSVTEKPRLPAADLTTKILIDYCIARVYEKAYKPERSSYFLQAYENGVVAWLAAISKRRGDWPDQVHSFGTNLEGGSDVVIY